MTKEEYIKKNYWLVTNVTIDDYLNNQSISPYPSEECVDEFAEYNGMTFDVAMRFFNQYCAECEKHITTKSEIGINLKYSNNPKQIYCKDCFKKKYHFSDEDYQKRIEIFKDQDCVLF